MFITEKKHMDATENPILVEIAKAPEFTISEGELVNRLIQEELFKELIKGIQSDEKKKEIVSNLVKQSTESFEKNDFIKRDAKNLFLTSAGKYELIKIEDPDVYIYQCTLSPEQIKGITNALSIEDLFAGKGKGVREYTRERDY